MSVQPVVEYTLLAWVSKSVYFFIFYHYLSLGFSLGNLSSHKFPATVQKHKSQLHSIFKITLNWELECVSLSFRVLSTWDATIP